MQLTTSEHVAVRSILDGGQHRSRRVKRAQILLAAADGIDDATIAATVRVSESTVLRTRRRFSQGGIEDALEDRPRPGAARKLSVREEALLVATACSSAPRGRARWTLTLLAQRLVRLTRHASISSETVRRRLHENDLKPWQEKMWCIPAVNREFLERMEDVLGLYMRPSDARVPIVCFDETPIQLLDQYRSPVPAAPGRKRRVDYEYRRRGTANVFVMVDPRRGWRRAKVTRRRTKVDFANCMRELVDKHYPLARTIRVVLDNLSTHSARAIVETFGVDEADRILRRIDLHHTPKHASWLNMAEIEIGVMKAQCLARRIADIDTLRTEVAAWERERNRTRARIRWMFSIDKARERFGSLDDYASVDDHSAAA